MKIHIKPIFALAAGSILLSGLTCQTVHAQLTPGGPGISGASIMADALGDTSGPEVLTVDWSVVESLSDVYTYSYDVNNPAGDIILPPNGPGSEIVDKFSVDFNTALYPAAMGAVGIASASGLNSSAAVWVFGDPNIVAGGSSGLLTITSDDPPSPGNPVAQDANPPSPWNGVPDGDAVPVPGTGNFVPDSTSTMMLLAGMMLLFLPFSSTIKRAVQK